MKVGCHPEPAFFFFFWGGGDCIMNKGRTPISVMKAIRSDCEGQRNVMMMRMMRMMMRMTMTMVMMID